MLTEQEATKGLYEFLCQGERGKIYVECMTKPMYVNPRTGAKVQHYIGFVKESTPIKQRHEQHMAGRGAKILRAAREQGIDFRIVRVIHNVTRADERRMKNQKNGSKFCPIHSPRRTVKGMRVIRRKIWGW